ncbi:MAG: hypothetical protein M1819_004808 [Sarea resinae]|nr:MAG: hypothetical protein M1819_004808 [Sarea resinae]
MQPTRILNSLQRTFRLPLSHQSPASSSLLPCLRPSSTIIPRSSASAMQRQTAAGPTATAAAAAAFSTSSPALARKKHPNDKKDPRITLLRYHLQHPRPPRPLRFSRLRSLRHWTIHRAYNLYRATQRAHEQAELERVYNSMSAACEELRTGAGDGGRLFRVAMTKKGIYAGVPVEYARVQTEWPAKGGWNVGWER